MKYRKGAFAGQFGFFMKRASFWSELATRHYSGRAVHKN